MPVNLFKYPNLISLTLFISILFSSCLGHENKIKSTDQQISTEKEKLAKAKTTPSKDSIPKMSSQPIEGDSLLKHPIGEPYPKTRPYYHLTEDIIDNNVYYTDTVTARNTEELIKLIKSNRVIQLIDKEYILRASAYYQNLDIPETEEKQGLLIDSIKNLKIVGTGNTKLLAYERNATVLKFTNSHNIHLDNLILGHTENPDFDCEQGVLRISYSYNFNISNCKLYGSGTFGLVTYAVYNLQFHNSEITECTSLIFDIERSRKLDFKDSKFHNNHLMISVLGGFTNASKEITFLNCEFLDNKPHVSGNPAFNLMDQQETILFKNCTFKNNKGFKWYGEIIELDNCLIDSTDFIGLGG